MIEFEIKVFHKTKERTFIATFFQLGYSYRIEADVNGTVVRFEPDEERNWRAIIADSKESTEIDKEVLQEIVKFLSQNF